MRPSGAHTHDNGMDNVLLIGAGIGAGLLVSGAVASVVASLARVLIVALVCFTVIVVAGIVLCVLLLRRRRNAPVPDQILAFREARIAAARRAVPRSAPPQIAPAETHYHVHFHGTRTSPERMPAVIQARLADPQQGSTP